MPNSGTVGWNQHPSNRCPMSTVGSMAALFLLSLAEALVTETGSFVGNYIKGQR